MIDPSTFLLATLLMKRDPNAPPPPSWVTTPTGVIETGIGFHPHELRLPTWAVELKLGPQFTYEHWPREDFILHVAAGWGMEYNISRPIEHFGLLEVGFGVGLGKLLSLHYLVGAQVGVFERRVDPAFRHGAALRVFRYFGPEVQHYVTGPQPTTGRPRQVVRVMFGFDLAWYLAASLL